MRIDQLALLFALAVAANLVLLIALELPRLGNRSRAAGNGPDPGRRAEGLGGAATTIGGAAERTAAERQLVAQAGGAPSQLYQRVTRIVGFLFIGSILIAALITGVVEPALLGLLAVGLFLIVLFQDLLPAGTLGRWRLAVEAAAATAFVTVLIVFTGGEQSPYFFGYILLVGAAALWASGLGPLALAAGTSVAYLFAVLLGSPGPLSADAAARVAFNLVAIALVTYIGAVIGREQRGAREEALRLSRFDSLTGLHSRDYLLTMVEQEVLRATRSGRPFGLLMIDLDGLKAANDRFGHASGDLLLRSVADVIRGDIRVTDVAARYGGDEFVLLLPETDLAGAIRVADKVRVDIARLTLPHNGAVIRTSASIGLVTFPDDGRTSAELIRRADLAMYEAKRRGRDQIVRFARQATVPMGAPSPVSSVPGAGERRAAPAPSVPPASPGPPPWESVR